MDFDVGADIKRRHQPRFVAVLKAKPIDMMCASAGFHRDNTGLQPLQKAQQTVSLETLAKNLRSRRVQSCKAANGLAQINAQNFDIHQYAPLSTYARNNSCRLVARQVIPLGRLS